MISIAIVTYKGGSGKSTVATNVAVLAHEAGQRVLLIDIDKQRTALRWGQRRAASGPQVVFCRAPDLHDLLGQAEAQDYEVVVIDTPGHDVDALVAAFVADFLVLICRPTHPDIEVTTEVRDAIVAAKRSYAVLLTQTPPALNRRLQAWCETSRALGTVVDVFVAARVDYQDAIACGLGVTELNSKGAAAAEMRAVFGWLRRRLLRGSHGE